MSLPLYQDVFEEGELKGRTVEFLNKLKSIIPDGKKVIVIMDAGFHIEWFKEIEKQVWSWVCRVRQGKDLKLAKNEDWISVENFMPSIGSKTMECGTILLTKAHKYSCRMVTTCKVPKGRVQKVSRNRTSSKTANGSYNKAAKEPWILVTNLSSDEYKGAEIVRLYSKRMQIEETFRVIKSHQIGLAGRYIRTLDVNRWGVLMLLSAIVIITYWVIGVVGYSQGMQRIFQPNTVKDKKIYSYFTLGKFIIEFNYLHAIKPLLEPLESIIKTELCRA
ncbi:IS4 family transposase [Candidatus Tisiphia endosymbiont of Mystacides longicornis]|uniref:IS4 family transposase n=1 Tax=Candidatus Tisiphia endosymbiont of Mystacides longicornis TaxID=3139330 RepID=UPI003CCA9963